MPVLPMSLIQFGGAGFDYAGAFVFRDVTFTLSRGERWGVVGRNGSGKSTLFALAAGRLVPSEGVVARAAGLRIAELDQHRAFIEPAVWDVAAAPFAELVALEHALADQSAALARDASPAALARYDEHLHRFERLGGYEFRAQVDAVLEGLGFNAARARTQAVSSLSGGERGRLGLARQLVVPADVLLLDEPTNHLDLETTNWLEEHLLATNAAVMVISHDRVFLDRVTDHMLHLEAGTAFTYAAGYARFIEIRAERRLTQQRAFDQQRRQIAAEQEYIRRNIAGQNSRQAKGRRTRLGRLPRLSPPPGTEDVMAVQLSAKERGGNQVLVIDDATLAFGARVLVRGFRARVERGERIGVIGANGTGKSTLLRALVGEQALAHGTARIGDSVRVSYYRQDLAQIPVTKTLFNAIHDLRPLWDRGKVQNHLGRYGFSGEEVQRVAGTLSGGEQARLALAMMVLEGANLLLFDEPTNHLDVESIEALEDALENYDGTVLLVSHDRALLRAHTTRIWRLQDGVIEDYPGSFGEWEEMSARRRQRERAQAAAEEEGRQQRQRESGRRAEALRRAASQRTRSARQAAQEAEAQVHAIESRIAELTEQLHDPERYGTAAGAREAARLEREIESLRGELDAAMKAWLAATEALEQV
jgi:ATP-binding cassette subfamily F protein 3